MPYVNGRIVSHEYLLHQGLSALSSTLSSDVTITNDGTQRDILLFNLPTGSFYVGMQFRFQFHALISYLGTGGGVIRIRMFLGSNPSTLVIAERATALTSAFCRFEGLATVRSLGATGSFQASGFFSAFDSVTASWNTGIVENSTIALDTTVASPEIRFTYRWATANASNSIVIKNASVTYL